MAKANSTVLMTPMQPKIQASKVSEFVPFCANEYVKENEEEKCMTIFTIFHEKLQLFSYFVRQVSI